MPLENKKDNSVVGKCSSHKAICLIPIGIDIRIKQSKQNKTEEILIQSGLKESPIQISE